MLLSHRVSAWPVLRASHEVHAAIHSLYRVHVYRQERLVSDDALLTRGFDRLGAVERPMATVILSGRACIRAFGKSRWLEPGDIALMARKGSVLMRSEAGSGCAYEHINIEWTPGAMGGELPLGLASGRLAPADVALLRDVARSLGRSEVEELAAAAAVGRMVDVLRANGLPLEGLSSRELVEPATEDTRRLLRALDEVLSDVGAQPMTGDLQRWTGLSSRQLNRVVESFHKRYGFNASTWRDARGRRRLMVGTSLMTVPGATTERVARAIGYRSAAAFCRALADIGLPAPGEIAHTVRLLA